MVVAVVALVVLQLVVVAVVVGGSRDQDLQSKRLDAVRASYAADSGVQIALREIATGLDENADGVIGGIGAGNVLSGASLNLGHVASAISVLGAENSVTITAASGEAKRRITSTVRRVMPQSSGVQGLLGEWWTLGTAPSSLSAVDWTALPTDAGPVPDLNFTPLSASAARVFGGPTQHFAARFTAKLQVPAAGTWTFATTSDDNSQLFINGSMVVNNDFVQGMTRRTGTIVLTAGTHDIEVRWLQGVTDHGLIAEWSGPGVPSLALIPASRFSHQPPIRTINVPPPSSLTQRGWTLAPGFGNFNGINFNNPPNSTTTISQINYPYAHVARWPGGPTTNFAVQITGFITFPTSGTWNLGLTSDDGSRLIFNGTQIINMKNPQGMIGVGANVVVVAGQQYPIDVRWFQGAGPQGLIMDWTPPSGTRVAVPASAFSSGPATSYTTPLYAHIAVDDQIELWGSNGQNTSFIDAFDSSVGVYGGSNVLSTGAIVATNATAASRWQMSGRAEVRADARTGVGSVPSSVIVTSGSSTITGTRTAAPLLQAIALPQRPSTLPATEGALSSGSVMNINTDRRFSSVSLWSNATWNVSGDVAIYVDGSFQMADNAAIVVAAGSRLRLYISGSIGIYNNAVINESGGMPGRCFIFHDAPLNTNIDFTDDAQVYAHIRSARGRLSMSSNDQSTDLFGTFRGRSLTLNTTARVHVDIAAPTTAPTVGGMTVLNWAQVP
jgi:hypothetical protein